MAKLNPLSPRKLRPRSAADHIHVQSSDHIGTETTPHPQPRALQALEMSLHIRDREHNVYLAGTPGLGRTYFVQRFLAPKAKKLKTPPDVLYLYNFDDPDKPQVVSLPPGQGHLFQQSLRDTVQALEKAVPERFAGDRYLSKKEDLIQHFTASRADLLEKMETRANTSGFSLSLDAHGALALNPLLEGRTATQEEFEQLPAAKRKRIHKSSSRVLSSLLQTLRRLDQEETELERKKHTLDTHELEELLGRLFGPLRDQYSRHKDISRYLDRVTRDILDNVELFQPADEEAARERIDQREDLLGRYRANLFVDNSGCQGAPLIIEDHPTYFNLLGCIERETEMGTLHTDFSLLRPGSLHRANGGFLIINAEQLVSNPPAWEGLLRSLRSGKVRLEDPTDGGDGIRTRTIEPAPVELDVRIVLVGTDELFELLLYNDERFTKFFKLKAHLQDWTERNARSIRRYTKYLAEIIRHNDLLPFDRDALATLVDSSSRLVQDQKKLSLHFPVLREIMLEANGLARQGNGSMVRKEHVLKAESNREFRGNLYEQEFLHEYDREALKVPTSGRQVGRAIGLSVSQFGEYIMALPHLISCTAGVGHGGVLDLEREAELGGPIHTKGMMILKSYFLDRFAQDKPLTFTGSICFEQSYAHVDGDSASGAELASLLSALSEIPVDLSLAFTGAVSQSGAILAVGEVSRKIEGFFEVCRRRGLTGTQGVLIPEDNIPHLMLKEEVVQAVREGKFAIYPVQTIEQSMEILTGVPAGRRLKRGGFSQGSLYAAVDERLANLAALADKPPRLRRKSKT